MGSFLNKPFVRAAVWLLAAVGCNNSDTLQGPPPPGPWVCEEQGRPSETDAVCPSGQRFIQGACAPARCDAGPLSNYCCPGTFCDPGGTCQVMVGKLAFCTKDTDCTRGLVCLERPLIDARKTCGFASPDANNTCPDSTQWFNQRCVGSTPCGGTCANGQVCNIDTNKCEPAPSAAAGADNTCTQTCPQGSLLVFSNPNTMLFNQCCGVSCHCEAIPGVPVGRVGAYADATVHNGDVLLASYDPSYGDLTLSTYSTSSLTRTHTTYIDGIPSSGTPTGNPSGPRKGLAEPGPNTGKYPSLAVHNGRIYIAYYDVDQQQLKIAVQESAQSPWKTSVIDNTPGDVGRYNAIAVDDRGVVHVSYLAQRISTEGGVHTGPYYARSKSASFNGPNDWDKIAVESVQPCEETCANGEACVLWHGESTCLPQSSACAAPCACDSTCVRNGTPSACAPHMPASLSPLSETPSLGLPNATGLFTQITLFNQTPSVVYYDSLRHHLRVGVAQFATQAASIQQGFATFPLVCVPGIDVGQHAHLATHPTAGINVAFAAFESQELWYYHGSSWTDGTYETIDNGERDNGVHRVAGGLDLVFTAQQQPLITYADQTSNDVWVAYKSQNTWTRRKVAEEGALGSFPNAVFSSNTWWVGTYQRLFSAQTDLSTYRFYPVDNIR
jgi:hypothetical protein